MLSHGKNALKKFGRPYHGLISLQCSGTRVTLSTPAIPSRQSAINSSGCVSARSQSGSSIQTESDIHLYQPSPLNPAATFQPRTYDPLEKARELSDIRITGKNRVFPSFRPYNKSKRAITFSGNQVFVSNPSSADDPVSTWWLRDHCPCSQCVHPQTRQRQDFARAEIAQCGFKNEHGREIEVTWTDGHRSVYQTQFLTERLTASRNRSRYGLTTDRKLWHSTISEDPPKVKHSSIDQGGSLGPLLHKIREYGFCFVEDCPPNPEATQQLLERIGPIRNTHYGGFYDFTSDLSSKDTAYTNLGLEAHTDTTYFSDPAGLQALHLLSHEDGSGGESLLVDGFAAASLLYRRFPKSYRALSAIKVFYHASGNDGVSMAPYSSFPVLQHGVLGELVQVRWNNADRAGIDAEYHALGSWYNAAWKFDKYLALSGNQYWFQLKPGTPLIIDNWRVLHGRAAFTGKRRICGAYINRDDFISKYRASTLDKMELQSSTVTG